MTGERRIEHSTREGQEKAPLNCIRLFLPAYAGGVPSYRVTITIGRLAPGVRPDAVLPAAAEAAAEFATVEASDVAIVRGAARITVRFAEDDDEIALSIGNHVVARTSELAEPLASVVTVRDGGRWIPVR